MADAQPQAVEPFVDLVSRPDGRFACVGYRAAGLGHTLASVELPIHVLEQAVTSGLELFTMVTPAGEIVSHIFGSSKSELSDLRSVNSIDRLVSQTVSPKNLRLEEASTTELGELLKSLELAIEHVRAALMQASVET
ncbi:hypothetical protein ACSHT2_06170 [Bradyrhizobium sp. PUT101]|uniref:hypothetical protein n=1 Tax=Bradyrhizobium sp. PUT101 TaxID=3447427 RepID=UPI003F85DAFC